MEDFYGKKFHDFFLFFKFFFKFFSDFFLSNSLYRSKFFGRKGVVRASEASGGGVGERSEPSAGGLAVGAEGSVNSEFIIILDIRVEQGSFPRFAQSLSASLKNKYFAF